MTHVEAVEKLVGALAPSAEVMPLVEACRGLAALLDVDGSDPGVWREYRFMLRDLRGTVSGGIGDDLEKEFAELG